MDTSQINKLHALIKKNAEHTDSMCKFYCTQFLVRGVISQIKFRLVQYFNKWCNNIDEYYFIDKID